MLPPKTSYKIGSTQAGAAKIFSLRLPEDLAAKILTAGDVKLQLQLDPNNPTENKLLIGEGKSLPLTKAPETQSVDVARSNAKRQSVVIIGRVREKLLVKQELAQDKASAIRAQSEQAEKERLSRKTMTIDEPLKTSVTRSKLKPSVSSSSVAVINAATSSRSRLMARVAGNKKPTAAPASPRITKPAPIDRTDKSSTHSWSPPIDVFSKPAEPVTMNLAKKAKSNESLPLIDHVQVAVKSRLQSKAEEYKKLEQWMDRRLSIFEQLQKDLAMAKGNAAATERITNRVYVETASLNADKEYKWKMAEITQIKAEIDALRSQLASET